MNFSCRRLLRCKSTWPSCRRQYGFLGVVHFVGHVVAVLQVDLLDDLGARFRRTPRSGAAVVRILVPRFNFTIVKISYLKWNTKFRFMF